MFSKILIANRGEIAVRVIRACRGLGIRSVAIYSEADRDALHVRYADEAVCCGPARATESYLDAGRIVELAQQVGADAIHPGYGFLSENAGFAEAILAAGITFIGPSPDVIRAMGLKIASRERMIEAGVPVVPGGDRIEDVGAARQAAAEMGYPVLVKASAGGGGRGMRRVDSEDELEVALERAASEAEAAFGDGAIYLEKLLAGPRHIEIQVLADRKGHTIHLGERECSIQRRHQKLVEEAPAYGLTPELRSAMGEAAVRAARAVGYEGAGTCEFLMDASGAFYFLEMNTRIQVEHPVTEVVTGVDLVDWQIRIAADEPLTLAQEDVKLEGHAIEVRIYAEDPDKGFVPSPGPIVAWSAPSGTGIRLDSGFDGGQVVTPHYDPMIAKLIASGRDRDEALARLAGALEEFTIGGLRTGLPFLRRICANPSFRKGAYDTGFIEHEMAALPALEPGLVDQILGLIARRVATNGPGTVRVTLPKQEPVIAEVVEDEEGICVRLDGRELKLDVGDLEGPIVNVLRDGVPQTWTLVERKPGVFDVGLRDRVIRAKAQ